MELTVMVTGAGAPGTRGTVFALQEGARGAGIDLSVVAVDRRESPIARALGDIALVVPDPSDDSYGAVLNRVIQSTGTAVVVPQTTREIEWLSEHRDDITVPVLVNDRLVIDTANNKIATTQLFADLGLGAPAFRVADSQAGLEESVQALGYPQRDVIVKLPLGNGGRGVRAITARSEDFEAFRSDKPSGFSMSLPSLIAVLRTADAWPTLLVTEFIDGPEFSVDCYVGEAGAIAIPRRRRVIRTGISFETTLERNEQIAAMSMAAAQHIGLRGVFGFQYMVDGDTPRIIECNPRIQGTMIASLATGNNIIWAAVCDLIPSMPRPPKVTHDWHESTCSRYWGAVLETSESRVVV